MLVYKDGGGKDILGFTCDLCNEVTITDVIPNQHGEFRYICPRCGHHMRELLEDKKEETTMVNSYTVSNAAKRLNCSRATIWRAIQDGRFRDCWEETGYHGRPAWMIPSDQVEDWVTKGGFNQQGKKHGSVVMAKKQVKEEAPRTVYDPETGRWVPVLNFLGNSASGDYSSAEEVAENKKIIEDAQNQLNEELKSRGAMTYKDIFDPKDEFAKRAVKRVAKPKWTKVLDRTKEDKAMKDISKENGYEKQVLNSFAKCSKCSEPTFHPAALKVDGLSITIPKEVVEGIVQEQVRKGLGENLARIRKAMDSLNEELKMLEEVYEGAMA